MTTKQNIYRLPPAGSSFCVEAGQFRIGPSGMIKVLPARSAIRDEVIHHASHEVGGVIFAVSVIFNKQEDKHELADLSGRWEYHTVDSIEEKWPDVLPDNWLEQLINQHAIALQG